MGHISERTASDLVDGVLSDGESALLAKHCEHCASCRTLVDDYRRMHADISSRVAVPKGYWSTFDARLAKRLAGEKKRIAFPQRLRIPAAIAAALLLTVGISVPFRAIARPVTDTDMLSLSDDEGGIADVVSGMDDAERSKFLVLIDKELASLERGEL